MGFAMARSRTAQRAVPSRAVRCAVYTRKSSEDGLEQDFNSLDAQREACLAYIPRARVRGGGFQLFVSKATGEVSQVVRFQ